MILVDTSVWVDHLRKGEPRLALLLEKAAVFTHSFVVGEIACGNLVNRAGVLGLLQALPAATVAEPSEVLQYIETHRLAGKGIGYVDAHLLASLALDPGATLWTRDQRLATAAKGLVPTYAE